MNETFLIIFNSEIGFAFEFALKSNLTLVVSVMSTLYVIFFDKNVIKAELN